MLQSSPNFVEEVLPFSIVVTFVAFHCSWQGLQIKMNKAFSIFVKKNTMAYENMSSKEYIYAQPLLLHNLVQE